MLVKLLFLFSYFVLVFIFVRIFELYVATFAGLAGWEVLGCIVQESLWSTLVYGQSNQPEGQPSFENNSTLFYCDG